MTLQVCCNEGRWQARFGACCWPCSVGRAGVRRNKTEGDGATPLGCWPIRSVLYRPDRLLPPETPFPCAPLLAHQGWCDQPGDERYNRLVELPYRGRHERLWRDDKIYDCIVVLGYNDDPVIDGAGSAIFLHVARADYAATEGCVALARNDLLRFLEMAAAPAQVCIEAA